MVILVWILLGISLIIIIMSLIMSPNSNSFSGALVGSSDLDLFKVSKERGSKKIVKWVMFSTGLILMIGVLVARVVM